MIADSASIRSAFERLAAEGADLSQPLRWSFYFADATEEALLRVFAELEEYGYTLEALRPREDGTGWLLHVAKTEILAADKLHRRNVSFNELAKYCEAALYDGWEVDVQRSSERDV
jgi:hypothetical protein